MVSAAWLAGPGTPPSVREGLDGTGWPRTDHGDIAVYAVPALSGVPPYSMRGQYWFVGDAGWLGRAATVTTYGRPVRVEIGNERLDRLASVVHVRMGGKRRDYALQPGERAVVDLPADRTAAFSVNSVFVPEAVLHNGDPRGLSVFLTIRTVP